MRVVAWARVGGSVGARGERKKGGAVARRAQGTAPPQSCVFLIGCGGCRGERVCFWYGECARRSRRAHVRMRWRCLRGRDEYQFWEVGRPPPVQGM